MNLPNTISAARMATAPFLLVLPFIPTPAMRLAAFVLFVIAGLTDYWDGKVARTKQLVTDLGRLLDPLADKILLVATIVPVYFLMRPRVHWLAPLLGVEADPLMHPFATPFGDVELPWWILAVILGREIFMTVFRSAASRRGVVISAIPSAKWKAAMQAVWIGTAYFWFFASTVAGARGWTTPLWQVAANVIGLVGVATMTVAVALTLYSLAVYVRRYGSLPARQTATR